MPRLNLCKGKRCRRKALLEGSGGILPLENFKVLVQFGGIWCVFFCIFGEQIELSDPEYFRAYFDIARENPRFFQRLMQTF